MFLHLKMGDGVTAHVVVSKISAYFYSKNRDATLVYIGDCSDDNAFSFKGDQTQIIDQAIEKERMATA